MRNIWRKSVLFIIFLFIVITSSTADVKIKILQKQNTASKHCPPVVNGVFSAGVLCVKQAMPAKDNDIYPVGPQFLWISL
jgi:hypothetical protein